MKKINTLYYWINYSKKLKDIDSKLCIEEIEFPKPINPESFNV